MSIYKPGYSVHQANVSIYGATLLAKVKQRLVDTKVNLLDKEEIKAIVRAEWKEMIKGRRLMPNSMYGLQDDREKSPFVDKMPRSR